jgi:hypothetical protein
MTEQTWLELFKAWAHLAQKAFCKERAVSYSQFCIWRSKLIERQQAVKPKRAKPAFWLLVPWNQYRTGQGGQF